MLAEACDDAEPSVVSVAGGPCSTRRTAGASRRAGTVVWLRARPETLAGRVGDGSGRPLLGDDPAAALVRLDGRAGARSTPRWPTGDRRGRPDARAVADRIVDAVAGAGNGAVTAPAGAG